MVMLKRCMKKQEKKLKPLCNGHRGKGERKGERNSGGEGERA